MKKTSLFNVLSLVLLTLTSYSAIASPTLAAWFGVIIAGITVFLNNAYTMSGKWIAEGWSYAQWIVVLANIILNAAALVNSSALVPVEVVNFVTIGATIAIQFFGKNYITEVSDGDWRKG